MKSLLPIPIAVLFVAGAALADNFTESNVRKARAVIDAAVAAHGGDIRLSALETLVVESSDVNVATGQSRGAEPPWDRNPASGLAAVDLEQQRFFTKNHGTGGGFEFDNATIINGDASYQIDYRAGTRRTIAEPDFDTTSGPFMRVTPALLVRQVRDRAQNAYYLGETSADGETFDVVGFSMAVGPAISLYFEKDTGLLRRSERVLPNFGLVEYRFDDYKNVSGMPFNRKFTLYLNGDENLVRNNVSTRVNVPIDEMLVPDDELSEAPPVVTDELQLRDLGDDVYLVGGTGTYAMFVDMGEYVVAVGGTAGIADRIALLRERLGDKPIRYGVLTHHHFDHVLGVAPYEAEGATVVAARAHEKVVRDAASDAESLDFDGVDDRMVIEDGDRRIELIDIGPTAHTEHLLVTWLPEQGILFEADHFSMPQAGPAPPAVSSTRSFAEALKKHRIQPRLIVSAHSPRPGTMADLRAALEKDPVRVTSR